MIDRDAALSAPASTTPVRWRERDVLLYHLALGSGVDWPHSPPAEAQLIQQDQLVVLPTFAVIPGRLHTTEPMRYDLPGHPIDPAKVLHGSQEVRLHRPLPVRGSGRVRTWVKDVLDKNSAAVIVQASELELDDGTPLASMTSELFVRGAGGFGGPRGPSRTTEVPVGEPDLDLSVTTTQNQALVYRLCGDWNPLHSDPGFAARAGYPAPILHGLCTYGITCRILVQTLLGGDTTAFAGLFVRFAGVTYPGETLRIRAWRRGDRILVAVTAPERGDALVITDGVLDIIQAGAF